MVENSSRVHDALSAGHTNASSQGQPDAIPEETGDDFEDIQIEDGFGGFTFQRRAVPRSKSHDVLSSAVGSSSNKENSLVPDTPKSFQSEPGVGQGASPTWSKLPNEQPFVSGSLVDDVAAQAEAATRALKGTQSSRPQMRSKSLSNRARKQLIRHISQPQLVNTSQKMGHVTDIPKVDATLQRRALSRPIPQNPAAQNPPPSSSAARQSPVTRQTPGPMMRSPSGNSIPTDYKKDINSQGSRHVRRSSSFGHRGPWQEDDSWVKGTPTSPSSPRSDKSQKGLSRFMSRIRTRKGNDIPPLVEPYRMVSSPVHGQNATRSPSALSSHMGTPLQKNPSQDANQSPGVHLPLPSAGAPSLTGLFAVPDAPPRNSSHETQASGANSNTLSASSSALDPSPPIHARQKDKAPTKGAEGKSGRDTIVRRTIIVSTFDPHQEDRRKSTLSRKSSQRKAVDYNKSNGHKRTSSNLSHKTRQSLQDRPPTPPGPDGVSSMHRRKLSQEVIAGQPMPPMPKYAHDAPRTSTLQVQQAAPSRTSGVSEYGASLYDMYIDNDDDAKKSQVTATQSHGSMLSPPHHSMRQSVADPGGPSRHIEVTERADGSVVWQVIAGLADRSSSYSNSVGFGGGHSRQTSDTSQYSYLRANRTSAMSPKASMDAAPSRQNELTTNEDGRSLFAGIRGKHRKSFSFDGNAVPPLPGASLPESSPPPQSDSVGFDMATSPGQAATRIVYTSDAELAAMLESLASPDKSSARFAFQRVATDGSSGRPSVDQGDVAGVSKPSREGGERPQSIWTEKELAADPTGAIRQQRFKIEAEIYSLLQREQGHTHPM